MPVNTAPGRSVPAAGISKLPAALLASRARSLIVIVAIANHLQLRIRGCLRCPGDRNAAPEDPRGSLAGLPPDRRACPQKVSLWQPTTMPVPIIRTALLGGRCQRDIYRIAALCQPVRHLGSLRLGDGAEARPAFEAVDGGTFRRLDLLPAQQALDGLFTDRRPPRPRRPDRHPLPEMPPCQPR